ncbi:MAG: LacI family DNA-binding transcriptional regulator, partial [Chloroflexota bacterium]
MYSIPQRTVNPASRRLTIGYFASALHSIGQPVWQGIADEAKRLDLNIVCFIGADLTPPTAVDIQQTQQNIIYQLAGPACLDGLLSWASIVGRQISAEENQTFHDRYELPFATIARHLEGAPAVLLDNYNGMREAMKHLIEVHGYRRIAYIRGPEEHVYAKERYRGYLEALQAHGIPVDPNLITPSAPYGPQTGKNGVQILLDERQLQPGTDFEALVAVSEDTLFGAIEVLQARHVQIPDQLAAVGFDDTVLSQTGLPPVTTVAPAFYKLGQTALSVLYDRMHGKEVEPEYLIPGELIVRQSCGCLLPHISTVTAESEDGAQNGLETRKPQALRALAAAIQHTPSAGWEERLWDSFVRDLDETPRGYFLRELNKILQDEILAERDVFEWQKAISALRAQALPALESQRLKRAENIWQQARVLVGEMSQRAQVRYGIKNANQNTLLRQIEEKLVASFDLQDLFDVLAESLPKLGIPSCYLSLYEDARPHRYLQPAPQYSTLVMAYKDNQRIALPPEGQRFPTNLLVPEGLLPQSRQYSLMILPLFFQENQLGFLVLEAGLRETDIYTSLRSQISSALQGAMLVKGIEERSAELAQQNYILDMFMENVPDSIY